MKNKFILLVLLALTACQGNINIPVSIPGFKQAVALETYATDKYTYVLGFIEGQEMWLACPITNIIIGQTYFFKDELVMNQFRSKETGKLFDKILFVQELSTDPLAPNREAEFHHPNVPGMVEEQTVPGVSPANAQTGIAIETMNAAKYTYMLANVSGVNRWFAFPTTPIIIGKRYGFSDPMLMTNFESHELKRKFDTIYFLAGVQEVNETQNAGHSEAQTTSVTSSDKSDGKVITMADLIAHKGKYEGKIVIISGKVTKYNPEIMGRNWIHLRDGSTGDGGADITLTTQQTAILGNSYQCKGKVILNKDFGSGYKYDLIIEEATLKSK